ncbi:unnamed protein product [Alopecurus aequalis]
MAAACILVDSTAYVDNSTSSNGSTAQALTSNGSLIGVSLWPAHPPIPSRLSVRLRSDHQDLLCEPTILCTVDSFFVLSVAIGRSPPPQNMTQKMSDYFIYRAAGSTTGPDNEVGVLPCGGDNFTIAALSQTVYFNFMLYLFRSEGWHWTSKKVLVDPPQIPYPMPLPDDGSRHFQHVTNSVITIGGTIGWVDLWHGILLYDVLRDDDNHDKIRHVPLPVRPGSHGGMALDCCPKPYRSVTAVGDGLKFVELEAFGDRLPGKDPETRGPRLRIHGWELTTYTNISITGAPEDWKIDFTVNASGIRIDRAMRSALLRCGMLREAAERNLQNLWTCQPVLSLNDDEGTVVYLIARVKFLHPEAWVLAVDMGNNQVRAMAAIDSGRSTDLSLKYFPCRISPLQLLEWNDYVGELY